ARLALDPDHRSLVTAERLHTVPQSRQLLAAAHPLRRPVDGPHGTNVCPAQRECLLQRSLWFAGLMPAGSFVIKWLAGHAGTARRPGMRHQVGRAVPFAAQMPRSAPTRTIRRYPESPTNWAGRRGYQRDLAMSAA